MSATLKENKRVQILKLSAKNVKTLRCIEIDEFGAMTQIKGDTGQGKTSILEAIEGGLTGLDPSMVRRGADAAEIVLELDVARVSRIIKAEGGKDVLTVTDKASGKPIEKAKEFLKALLPDSSMFRPLDFVNLGRGDTKGRTERLRAQRNMLLDAMPVVLSPEQVAEHIKGLGEEAFAEGAKVDLGGVDWEQHGLAVCNALERVFYDARKAVNAKAEEAEGTLKHTPAPARPAPLCSLADAKQRAEVAAADYYRAEAEIRSRQATMERRNRLEAQIATDKRACEFGREELEEAHREQTLVRDEVRERIRQLREQLQAAEAEERGCVDAIRELDKALATRKRIEDSELELAQINESLGPAPDIEVLRKRAADAKADADAKAFQDTHDKAAAAAMAARQRANLYDGLVALFRDELPRRIVASMQMPVEGLGIEDGVVCFKGVPLHQLGTSEQLRVGVMVAAALNPRTGFILIDRAESLGSKDLRALGEAANELGLQLILTFVDPTATPAPGTIVMQGGERLN